MTLWSVVEPLTVRFKIDINAEDLVPKNPTKHSKSRRIRLQTRDELRGHIKDLIEGEHLSLEEVSELLGVALTTVRRACRTLKIGPNGIQPTGSISSRSSQTPFGWTLFYGHLQTNKEEWKWVLKIHFMRQSGYSLHKIAAFLCERNVPTKNGGRWFAKTVSQILEFNRLHIDSTKDKGR